MISNIDNKSRVLSLRLCTICNIQCSYCALGGKYDKTINLNYLNKLDKYDLENYEDIYIQGGEIGLLSKEELDLVFNYLKNRNINDTIITIYTNGLFLDKYKIYYSNYRYIYHITDINKFKIYNNINYFNNFVIYNTQSLDDFEILIKRNKEIIFIFNLDINMKSMSDKFFNKCKYILKNYDNVKIDFENNEYNNLIKTKLILRKNLFLLHSNIINKKCGLDIHSDTDYVNLY
jgi:hypothetical protein